eukprot:Awhi_evm1s7101
MGLSKGWASNIWLAGPLTGFFVAPIVGSLSDKCHLALGRRRPYMIAGLLLLAVVSTTLACSHYFGSAGLPVAITMFVMMDGTINVIQTPLRALIADFAPLEQQATGQLMASTFQGVGGLLGYALQKYLWKDPLSILVLFLVVLAINAVFIGGTCILVKEEHFPAKEDDNEASIIEPFVHLAKSIKHLTGKLMIVGACVFFCWWALFSWWPTSSTWYMTIVMKGCCEDPSEAGYNGQCTTETYGYCLQGQDINANANILANVAQIVIGLTFALLMNRGILVRVRFVWSALLVFGSVILIGSKFIKGSWFAYLVGVGMAVPISGINAFPFAIVGSYNQVASETDDLEKAAVDNEDMKKKEELEVGSQFGLLNLFIVVPQIIATVVIGQLRDNFGDEGLSWAIFAA